MTHCSRIPRAPSLRMRSNRASPRSTRASAFRADLALSVYDEDISPDKERGITVGLADSDTQAVPVSKASDER